MLELDAPCRWCAVRAGQSRTRRQALGLSILRWSLGGSAGLSIRLTSLQFFLVPRANSAPKRRQSVRSISPGVPSRAPGCDLAVLRRRPALTAAPLR